MSKAIKDENKASCSLDDRSPALLLTNVRKSLQRACPVYIIGLARRRLETSGVSESAGERNVRAPWERLVGNAHLPVTYPVKTGTDQCHRDETPLRGAI